MLFLSSQEGGNFESKNNKCDLEVLHYIKQKSQWKQHHLQERNIKHKIIDNLWTYLVNAAASAKCNTTKTEFSQTIKFHLCLESTLYLSTFNITDYSALIHAFCISVPPATVTIDNIEDVVLVVGNRVEISCRSGGSRPHATITWWIDNDNLQGGVLNYWW